MSKWYLLLVVAVTLCLSWRSVYAQDEPCSVAVPGQVFCDDFSDGSYDDGLPVTWNVGSRHDLLSISNGDLHVHYSVGDDDHAVGRVGGLNVEDVSIRTRGRLVAGEAVGIYARHDWLIGQEISAFVGGLVADGRVFVATHGRDLFRLKDELNTDLAPLDEDIIMQLDVIGTSIDFWAWRPGEHMPETPLVSFESDGKRSGSVAIIVGGSTTAPFGDVALRYVQVADRHIVPEPSSFALCALAFLALTASGRRLRGELCTSPHSDPLVV